jgi:hypothetical protein
LTFSVEMTKLLTAEDRRQSLFNQNWLI